jgi:hypothetical protein
MSRCIGNVLEIVLAMVDGWCVIVSNDMWGGSWGRKDNGTGNRMRLIRVDVSGKRWNRGVSGKRWNRETGKEVIVLVWLGMEANENCPVCECV